jgi:hypothetical protein
MPDLKEDVAEGEAPNVAASMAAHKMGSDEEMMNDMLDETSFKKRFGKKVG